MLNCAQPIAAHAHAALTSAPSDSMTHGENYTLSVQVSVPSHVLHNTVITAQIIPNSTPNLSPNPVPNSVPIPTFSSTFSSVFPLADSLESAQYFLIIGFEKYEILNHYPFTVRNTETMHEITEYIDKDSGYVRLGLMNNDGKQKHPYKHRLIGLMFIPNDDPDNLTDINHKNKIRTDNRIENLEWCTKKYNNSNKGGSKNVKYEFVYELPSDCIKINRYGNYTFKSEKYYYSPSENEFYMKTDIDGEYRILPINIKTGSKSERVKFVDIHGKNIDVYIKKFKKDNHLI